MKHMNRERYQRIREIFEEVCASPREQRAAILDSACGDDEHMRTDVEALLHHLDTPAFEFDEVEPARQKLLADLAASGPEFVAAPPESIGPFRILRLLGEGGMGVVYLAEQENPRRTVAIKIIRPGFTTPALLRRFEHEAHVLGRLQHPGIAQIYSAGTADTGYGRQPYLVMEYVDGCTLLEYVRMGGLSTRERLELFIRICEAVQHAHNKGVIHRDLKPANILVTEDAAIGNRQSAIGEDDAPQSECRMPSAECRVKVLDFGVARAIDSDVRATTLRTDVGQLIGTLAYMSPEQVACEQDLQNSGGGPTLDVRSDVYALGVICFELLSEKLPYDFDSRPIPEAIRIIREEDPRPLSSIDRTFKGDLETIVAKALEKDCDRRYQRASELAADIDRYLRDQPIVARPPSAMYQFRKFARRNRGLVAGIATAFIILIGGVAATAAQAVRATNERNAAQAEAAYARTVSEFLFDVLTSADRHASGAGTTIRDALALAVDKMEGAPPEHARVEAAIRATIGAAYTNLGLYSEAERHLLIAVDKSREWYGADAVETGLALSELARLRVHQGRYDEAEAIYLDVQEMYRVNPPEKDVHVANGLMSLATINDLTSRYEAAEAYAREALDVLSRIEGHERVEIEVLLVLAGALYSVGRSAEAEEIVLDANQRIPRLFGESSGIMSKGLNLLANIYANANRLDEAVALHREVVNMHEAQMGEDHPTLGIGVLNLGMTLRRLERFDEAEIEIRRAADIFERSFHREHPYTLHALAALGNLLHSTDRLDEAEPILREVLDARLRVLGEEHQETVTSIFNLVTLHRKRDQYDAAVELIRPCLAMHERKYGREDWRTISIVEYYAENVADAGDKAAAIQLYREAYEHRIATLGADNAHAISVRDKLIELLRDLGREDEADALTRPNRSTNPATDEEDVRDDGG